MKTKTLTLLVLLLTASAPLDARTFDNDAETGSWSNPSNWSPNGYLMSGETVSIGTYNTAYSEYINYDYSKPDPLTHPVVPLIVNGIYITGGSVLPYWDYPGNIALTGLVQGYGQVEITSLDGDIAMSSTTSAETLSFKINQNNNGHNVAAQGDGNIILRMGNGTGGANISAKDGSTVSISGNHSGDTTVFGGQVSGSAINSTLILVTEVAKPEGGKETRDTTFTGGTWGALGGSGTVTGTITVGGNNASTTFNGTIEGANTVVTKNGSGTMSLEGNNTYGGRTAIDGGRLNILGTNVSELYELGYGTTLESNGGLPSTSTVTLSTAATLIVQNQELAYLNGSASTVTLGGLSLGYGDTTFTYSGNISGTPVTTGLAKIGTGTLTLTGTGSWTGGTEIQAGTLSASAYGLSDAPLINNGTLIHNGNRVLGAPIRGDGDLILTGGTLVLAGANTYTGQTRIDGGTLSGIVSPSSVLNVDTYGTYDLTGSSKTVGSLAGAGNVRLGTNPETNLTIAGTGEQVFSGLISGSGNLVKTGGMTQTIAGGTYTGNTYVNGGILVSTGNLPDTTALTVAEGAAFKRIGSDTIGSVSGTGVVELAGSLSLNSNDTYTSQNILTGTGALTKYGTGTLTLTGAGTMTGSLNVSAGTIRIAAGTPGELSKVYLGTNVSFVINNPTTIGSLNSGTSHATSTVLNKTLTTGGNNETTMLYGIITGAGGLTKTGTGTMTLYGTASNYTGDTTVNGGTLKTYYETSLSTKTAVTVNPDSTLYIRSIIPGSSSYGTQTIKSLHGDGTAVLEGSLAVTGGGEFSGRIDGTTSSNFKILGGTFTVADTNVFNNLLNVHVLNKGTLNLNNHSETINSLKSSSTATAAKVQLGSGRLGVNATSEFYGVISGTGGITVNGGTTTLYGSNTYTGRDEINGTSTKLAFARTDTWTHAGEITGTGTLELKAGTMVRGGDLGNNLKVNILAGATLDMDGGTDDIGSLTGSGNVKLGVGILATGYNNTNDTFYGKISGDGGFIKAGTGTLTLRDGKSTYTGPTEILGGTLLLSGGTLSDLTAVTVGSNGLFQIGLSGWGTQSEAVGSLAGGGNTVLYSTSILGAGSNNTSTTYDGIINGAGGGGLHKYGTGTMTLTGSQAYTGPTRVYGGTLAVSGPAGSIQSSSLAQLYDGGTLTLDNSAGDANRYGDAKYLYLYGGTLELKGGSETIGTVTISGGASTVKLSGGAALTTTQLARSATATTLDFSGIDTTTNIYKYTATSGPTLTNGILPYATVNRADFATYDSGTKIFSAYTGYAETLANGSTTNFKLSGATTYDGNLSVNSLVLNDLEGACSLAGTGTATLTSGAFIVNGANATIDKILYSTAEMNAFINGNTTVNSTLNTTANGFAKSGTGTLTVGSTGAITTTGTISALEGTIALGRNDALAGHLTVNGGTVDLGGYADTVGTITLLNGTIAGSAGNLLTTTGSVINVYNGTISASLAGTAGLTKATDGSIVGGTVILSGQNAYTGTTTVTGGTLEMGRSDVLADAGNLTVNNSAAVLNMKSYVEDINVLTLSNGLITGEDGSEIACNSMTWGYGSVETVNIVVGGTLTKTTGTGYMGGFLSAGTLSMASGSTIDMQGNDATIGSLTGSGNITNMGTLDLGASGGSSTFTGNLTGSELIKNGIGTATLSGTNISTGVTLNDGTLSIPNATGLTNVTQNGGTLTLGGSNTTIVGGGGTGGNVEWDKGDLTVTTESDTVIDAITGPGWLHKYGEAKMVLAGRQEYIGVKVHEGTLAWQGNHLFADTIDMYTMDDASAKIDFGSYQDKINDLYVTTGSVVGTGLLECNNVYLNGSGIVSQNVKAATVAMNTAEDVYLTGTNNIITNPITLAGGGTLNTQAASVPVDISFSDTDTSLNFFQDSAGTYSHVISGSGSLIKTGTGRLTLTGTQTYSGATTVEAGALAVFGTLLNTDVTVQSGAILSGTGEIYGATEFLSGSYLSPGASPGTLAFFDDVTWNGGGQYLWEIDTLAADGGSAGNDPGWDLMTITGADLIINATSTDKFIFDLATLSHVSHEIAPLDIPFDKTKNYSWLIAQVTGGAISYADPNWWSVNTDNFDDDFEGGSFSVRVTSGTQMYLDFTGTGGGGDVPEPSTLLLLLPFIGFGLKKLRRRTSKLEKQNIMD